MKINFVPDRVMRRPDPVEAKDGVFAELAEDEMSPREVARLGSVGADLMVTSKPDTTDERRWTPSDILKRVTKLYARFVKPKEKT